MIVRLFYFCLPAVALLLSQTIVAGAQDAGARDLYEVMRGVFLAAHQRHVEAADALADVGRRRRDAKVMEAAVQSAIRAQDINKAQQYAAAWLEYGGGIAAQQVIAELFIINNQLPDAEKVIGELMRREEQSAEDLYRQLSAARQPQEALAIGRRLFPQTADGQFYMALLGLHANAPSESRTAINNALQHDRARPDFHFFSAYLAAREKDSQQAALPVLEEYAAANCYDGVRHCALPALMAAFAGYINRKHSGADEWRLLLNADKPAKEDWHLPAAALYEQWGLPARAKAEYEQLPDNFYAHIGLARIAEKEQGAQVALEILQNTPVEEKEFFVQREKAVAHLLNKTTDTAAAIARLQEARLTVPEDFSLLYLLSLLMEENGQLPEALEVLMELTLLFPENPDGWNALGYVMADNNINLATAQAHVERALLMRPNAPHIIDSLGWVHYRLGMLETARKYLEKAVSLSDSAEIAAHFGEVLWELGDTGKAKMVWQAALARDPDNQALNAALRRYNPF